MLVIQFDNIGTDHLSFENYHWWYSRYFFTLTALYIQRQTVKNLKENQKQNRKKKIIFK